MQNKVWHYGPSGCCHRQRYGQRYWRKSTKYDNLVSGVVILKHVMFHYFCIDYEWNGLKFILNISWISCFKKKNVCCIILIHLSSVDILSAHAYVVWIMLLKHPFLLYSMKISLQFMYFNPLSLDDYQAFW